MVNTLSLAVETTPKPSAPELDVLAFETFGEVVREEFRIRALANPGFTVELWSKRLGLRNPATLLNIMSGRRIPGPGLTEKITDSMALTTRERDYLRLLLARGSATAEGEIALHRRAILEARGRFACA